MAIDLLKLEKKFIDLFANVTQEEFEQWLLTKTKPMAQQTAVSWVIEQLRQLAHNPKTHLGMGDIRVTQGYLDEIEEQAKQMEEEQIIDAHNNGKFVLPPNENGEQYYNETYKKD